MRARRAGHSVPLSFLLGVLLVVVAWGARPSSALVIPPVLQGDGPIDRAATNSSSDPSDATTPAGEGDTTEGVSGSETTGHLTDATDLTDATEHLTDATGLFTSIKTTAASPGGTTPVDGRDPTDEAAARKDIDAMAAYMQPIFVRYQQASWLEETDHTGEHSEDSVEAAGNFSAEYAAQWKAVIDFYDYEAFTDPALRRRFELQATPGTAALPEEELQQLAGDINNMTVLSLQKLCPYDKQDCDKDKEGYTIDDLEGVLAEERDKNALVYYWEEWRNVAGRPTKEYFVDYVKLMNEAATNETNGFTDAGEMWLQPYEAPHYTTEDFKGDVKELWENTKGLYEKLHAYVRYRLRDSEDYTDYFAADSPIPAHILGNMWAQSWENIYDLVVPYEDAPLVDISETLQNNITNVTEMFRYSEDFFTSLGLYNMTPDFWGKSVLLQEEGKEMVCHASAWDFLSVTDAGPITDGDFRIKMCTDLNQEDFIAIHHEMGHTQYQMAYSQVSDTNSTLQPLIFRDGANPGFHEAIGDTIALSVFTPSHLECLQEQISEGTSSCVSSHQAAAPRAATTPAPVNIEHRNINQLMRMALEKVAFIPYAYILDQFRWDVFAEAYGEEEYNYQWWKLRVSVQGLKPPVLREKNDDFDPGCKYHVASGVPYIRYFVATILQFQFHERLCDVGGKLQNNKTVFECDIYGTKDSGDALKELLRPGRSQPWTEQLGAFMGTGENGTMTSDSILRYFAALEKFLDEQIAEHDIKTGWDDDVDKYFVQNIPATVPIVVGVVLCVMIVVVIVAYFVGKNRSEKKSKESLQSDQPTEANSGKDNPNFEMEEKKSVSSNDS